MIGESEHHNYYRIIILYYRYRYIIKYVCRIQINSGMPFVGFAFKRICKNLVKFAEQIKPLVFFAFTSPSYPPPLTVTATAVRDCYGVVYER